MSALPISIDLMPLKYRKPKAGPLLEPKEAIAIGLLYGFGAKFDEDGKQVKAILEAIKGAGYKIEPI